MGELNRLQSVGLDILSEFSRICAQEKLTWYAAFGTLLGAVRHKGFIPWDDDVDVAMPRADYDRMRKYPELFASPYFLQTPQNDPAAAPRFMRLRRSDTTVISGFPNGLTRGGNMGAYIDIFPLDNVTGIKQAQQLNAAVLRMQEQMRASAALDENVGSELPDWKAEICYGLGGVAGCYPMLAERYEWLCSRYSSGPYCFIPVLGNSRGYRIFDKNWFSVREKMSFEGVEVFVPAGWRELLVACYPEGLLEPDADERKSKHNTEETIVDMERSYKDYVSRYTDMLENIEGKRVLLFGAGDSLRIWLERYSHGLSVVCAFDNSESKWGTSAYGLPVRSPKELPSLISEDSRIIIASIWRCEISKQLEQMGISDYYIFNDGLNYRRV